METLYGCGLRVSELLNLELSKVFLDEGFISVAGKGNKERLVPLGEVTADALGQWLLRTVPAVRSPPARKNYVFLAPRTDRASPGCVCVQDYQGIGIAGGYRA